LNNLAIAKNVKKLHRAYNTRTSVNRRLKYASQIGSNHFQISRAMRLVLAICRRTTPK
jgi:thiamine monophosphate synthase